MRAVLVVVCDVLRQDLLEMTPTEDEEPIEALPAHGADETLGHRVRARRPSGRLDDPGALGTEDLVEAGRELRVPVPDQELYCSGALGEVPAQVAGLLGRPEGCKRAI